MPSRRSRKAWKPKKAPPTQPTQPARPRLHARDDMVFSCLFKAEGEMREDIEWGEFIKAMDHVGFLLDSGGRSSGSGTGFTAPEEFGSRRMRLDGPHGPKDGILRAADQNSLAKRLNQHFQLDEYIARLRLEAQQPPAQQ
ncbi:hypothetical protein L226DRAFT_617483, partial [Lentinus tigrinus ALCF2SS1-7]|uniref:uncharacterized protein n=1 Tax=Lentinus tigrinus ALCF2SS1-7 TaxID=1328758 RepID=UPI0011662FC8